MQSIWTKFVSYLSDTLYLCANYVAYKNSPTAVAKGWIDWP